MTTYATDKRYAVEINPINHGTLYRATALMFDSYGGDFWFHIGDYKTLDNAQKGAKRQMLKHGKVVEF